MGSERKSERVEVDVVQHVPAETFHFEVVDLYRGGRTAQRKTFMNKNPKIKNTKKY